MSQFQQAKLWLVETLQLCKDALHVHVGLLVFFCACLLFRRKAWQWKPWLCVLGVALAGEAWDLADSLRYHTPLDLGASLKDLANTVAAPTLILVLARYSALFARAGTKRGHEPASD